MSITTRFAPSPTGRLHLGNIRTAILNWLAAKHGGGRFILRIDDTDAERSEERYVEAIRADLHWLGLVPDAEFRQSERFVRYDEQFEVLRAAGRVYPCFETPEELDLRRKILRSRGLPPVYERGALDLSADEVAARIADGQAPHWRFLLDHAAPIEWQDGVRGAQHFDPAKLSDPVVRRADGSWLYLLPSVIDDADMAISDVVRGEDHVSNTAVQVQMFEALGAALPRFAHVALLTAAEGKLSKRLGSASTDEWRAGGIEPQAVVALLARIGTRDPVEAVVDPAPLIAGFDLSRFGRAPAHVDEAELAIVNARIIHQLPFAAVADRLPAGMDATAWEALRPNAGSVAEAAALWPLITGPIDLAPRDPADVGFLEEAARLAATLDWQADPWHALTGALKASSGRKGRALFLPLRRALTGRDEGPEMAALLPLIAQDEAVRRLSGA